VEAAQMVAVHYSEPIQFAQIQIVQVERLEIQAGF
jgi:hypothetical protein